MKKTGKSISKFNQFIEKKIAREYFKEIRKSSLLYSEEIIIQRVEKYIKRFKEKTDSKKLIGIYWPIDGEVDLRSLKKSSELALALPACTKSSEISYHRWTDDPLEKDIYGIPAPLGQLTQDLLCEAAMFIWLLAREGFCIIAGFSIANTTFWGFRTKFFNKSTFILCWGVGRCLKH